jgi:hypothetical protein
MKRKFWSKNWFTEFVLMTSSETNVLCLYNTVGIKPKVKLVIFLILLFFKLPTKYRDPKTRLSPFFELLLAYLTFIKKIPQ